MSMYPKRKTRDSNAKLSRLHNDGRSKKTEQGIENHNQSRTMKLSTPTTRLSMRQADSSWEVSTKIVFTKQWRVLVKLWSRTISEEIDIRIVEKRITVIVVTENRTSRYVIITSKIRLNVISWCLEWKSSDGTQTTLHPIRIESHVSEYLKSLWNNKTKSLLSVFLVCFLVTYPGLDHSNTHVFEVSLDV